MVHGAACNVTLKHCTLERCTLVALHGARVTLESTTMASDLISVFAAGRGTAVKATGRTTITGGMQVRSPLFSGLNPPEIHFVSQTEAASVTSTST